MYNLSNNNHRRSNTEKREQIFGEQQRKVVYAIAISSCYQVQHLSGFTSDPLKIPSNIRLLYNYVINMFDFGFILEKSLSQVFGRITLHKKGSRNKYIFIT